MVHVVLLLVPKERGGISLLSSFFDSIIVFFSFFWTFLRSLVEGLLLFVSVMSSALTLPVFWAGYVPGIIYSSVLIVVSVAVIKLIVGRQ